LLTLLGGLVLAYGLLVAFFWIRQESLLFLPGMPSRDHMADPGAIGLDFEVARIRTADGETLDAWFVPASPALPARGTVLFFHGNAGNISHRLDSIRVFHSMGLSVLIPDYRGYGRSTGKPSEAGLYEDARAAWRWLTDERGTPPERIVVFGRSMGGAVAAWLAARVQPAGLIVESTFRSAPRVAAELYPFLPVRALARLSFDAEAELARVGCPVLVVHSREDEIIPYAHGEALRAAAPDGRGLVTLSGGHNDAFLVSREVYVRALDDFLGELGL
jgi:fermentation-respiration switch protein FrsA (DUF1100 family)